jgi:uncharacterized RDD family membrane protein YckC
MKKCPYCGKEYPDEVELCAIDQYPLRVPDPAMSKPDRSPYAGFGIRLVARMLDVAFAYFMGFVAGFIGRVTLVALSHAGIITPGWSNRINGGFSLGITIFGLLGIIAYHVFCEGMHGATIGKVFCGLRVVGEDGKPSNLKGALIRTLGFYIDGLFFGLIGYIAMAESPLYQRNGDVWAKTAVVRISRTGWESQRTPIDFMAGLLMGVCCMIIMLVLGLVLSAL